MSDENPWKIKSTDVRYTNPWITIEHNEVVHPGGSTGIYGVVQFTNLAIGIVTLDEENHTHLVGQYRFPLREYSWEIPEGGCPPGEDPLACAKRELKEETGLSAKRWTQLGVTTTSNSVTDERGIIFLAEELTQGEAAPEDSEELRVRRLPVETAINMCLTGEIHDALSMLGLLLLDKTLR